MKPVSILTVARIYSALTNASWPKELVPTRTNSLSSQASCCTMRYRAAMLAPSMAFNSLSVLARCNQCVAIERWILVEKGDCHSILVDDMSRIVWIPRHDLADETQSSLGPVMVGIQIKFEAFEHTSPQSHPGAAANDLHQPPGGCGQEPSLQGTPKARVTADVRGR